MDSQSGRATSSLIFQCPEKGTSGLNITQLSDSVSHRRDTSQPRRQDDLVLGHQSASVLAAQVLAQQAQEWNSHCGRDRNYAQAQQHSC